MTEVTFHFNVPDRTDYTCRLLRKASRAGASVVLTAPSATLAHFDRALWTFDALEFLPHVMLKPNQPVPDRLRATKLWLVEDVHRAEQHDVLVNLGTDAPQGFETFAKLIEIVTSDESDRAAARSRWKHYESRGYEIKQHRVVAA